MVVKVVQGQVEMDAAIAIRFRVFVDEQGVPPEEEQDALDASALHVIALAKGTPIGTGRLVHAAPGDGQIGRMAVDRHWRRQGVGSMILGYLEEEARRLGIRQAVLHAQTYVKAFYSAHGYREEGEVFMDAGIEHVLMRKKL